MWLILLLVATISSPPRCAIAAQPLVSLSPLRFVRTRVTIEPDELNYVAYLSLDGVTSSEVHVDARTRWVEWRNIDLGAGTYQVTLEVFNARGEVTCRATQRLTVGGDQ